MLSGEGGAILLVDDDPDALTILANALEHHGYRTFLARNAEAGLKIIEEEYKYIDCIVLDILMPGRMDGYALMLEIKKLPQRSEIPVLVLSARTSTEDIARSYQHGAFQHLCKPCDISHLSSIIRNIVRLRELERKSLSDAKKYQAIVDNSPIQIAVVSTDFKLFEMNRSFRETFPSSRLGDDIFASCFELPPEGIVEHPISRALASGKVENGQMTMTLSGARKHLDIRAAPIRNSEGEIRSIIYICVDATDQIEMKDKLLRQVERYNRVLREQDRTTDYLIQAQKELQLKGMELERLSLTDALTGLNNRRQFDMYLETESRRAGRYRHPLTLLMIDIDHFKSVNDEHGHPVGDLILKELAEIFIGALRETDCICRYGGEEFAIILPETDSQTAVPIADRLRQLVEAHDFETPVGRLGITISVGTASIQRQVINPQRLLEKADKCLYTAKNAGRNQVASVDIH